MEKRETGVGAYYFCDIAMSYFPLLSKKKASDKLSRWIRVSGKLMERLGRSADGIPANGSYRPASGSASCRT